MDCNQRCCRQDEAQYQTRQGRCADVEHDVRDDQVEGFSGPRRRRCRNHEHQSDAATDRCTLNWTSPDRSGLETICARVNICPPGDHQRDGGETEQHGQGPYRRREQRGRRRTDCGRCVDDVSSPDSWPEQDKPTVQDSGTKLRLSPPGLDVMSGGMLTHWTSKLKEP